MKKKIISVIFILCILSFPGCAKKFDYPDNLTPRYCLDNYTPMASNYAYLQAYSNCVSGKRFRADGASWFWFYAIPSVPEDKFLACCERHGLYGYGLDYVLYRENNCTTDPLFDFEIDYIEICLYHRSIDKYIQTAPKYGNAIYYSNLKTTFDVGLFEQLKDCIKSGDNYYPENYAVTFTNDFVYVNKGDTEYSVALRIHFKEYENIIWHARVLEHQGIYYLQNYMALDDNGSTGYLRITDDLQEFIKNAIDATAS